jgi:hypothetical protein
MLSIQFNDRLLRHLQIVIGAKLRRGESFFFTWKEPDHGIGRSAIWLDRSVPVFFRYSDATSNDINREWVEALAISADTPNGLIVVQEPPPQQPRR